MMILNTMPPVNMLDVNKFSTGVADKMCWSIGYWVWKKERSQRQPKIFFFNLNNLMHEVSINKGVEGYTSKIGPGEDQKFSFGPVKFEMIATHSSWKCQMKNMSLEFYGQRKHSFFYWDVEISCHLVFLGRPFIPSSFCSLSLKYFIFSLFYLLMFISMLSDISYVFHILMRHSPSLHMIFNLKCNSR